MKRFLLALNSGTPEQRNAVTAMLQAKGWPLWHHMEDVWLIANVPDDVTPKTLSEELESITLIGTHRRIVLEIPDGRLGYFGRASKDGWTWMNQFWGRPM